MQSGPPSVSASGAAPQLPIVMLVFGFPATAGSSSGGGGSGQQCLSLGQLEALVHEFGHALHSLLSRTTFQHLSGTRGALDLVEVPSHLMEELTVRNARVLTDWVAADTSHTPDGVGIGAGSAASLRCGLVEEALVQTHALLNAHDLDLDIRHHSAATTPALLYSTFFFATAHY